METQNQTHPSRRQLAALALDKLKPESKARLQEHVASCSTCSTFVSKTPRDTLIALLRDAGSSTGASDQSTPGIRDAGTLVGIPIAAKAVRPPAAPPRRPMQDPLIGEGPSEDTPKGHLADDEIPQALREQTKYRILRLLGRGGMGSVYEAHHMRMDRRVAIKTINPDLIDHPEALKRFDQEVKAAAKLDHGNVARAYDADQFGSLRVLVLEFVPGQSLDRFLAQRKQLSVIEACRLVRQAMVGLHHAHERCMVHRDLKPQNLMLTPDGKVKILDFGLAKVASERRVADGLTRENALMGTPHYLAPEQALDAAKADIRADIYSLGCTLYCLLAGEPPFNADTEMKVLVAHQNDAPRPLCEVRPDVPQDLSDFVDRMLAKDPADRPQTPMEAAQVLWPFAKGDGPGPAVQGADPLAFLTAGQLRAPRSAPPPVRSGPVLKPRQLWFWAVGAGVLLVALFFGAWAAGVLTIRASEGTIIVENVPAAADVLVDDQTVKLSRDGEVVTITAVAKGDHHLKLVQAGKEIWTSDVSVTIGGQPVRARYERRSQLAPQDNGGAQPEVRSQAINRDREALIDDSGEWKLDGVELVQCRNNVGRTLLAFGDPTWSRYDLTLEAKTAGDIKVCFDYRNKNSFRMLGLESSGNMFLRSCFPSGWGRAYTAPIKFETGRWCAIRVEVRDGKCKCALDGKALFPDPDGGDKHPIGGLIAIGASRSIVRFRNILVTSEDGKTILWKGNPRLPGEQANAPPAEPEGTSRVNSAAPTQQYSRRIDLLKRLDLSQDVVEGEWSINQDSSVLTCQLGLGTSGLTEFKSVEVFEITGKGTLLRPSLADDTNASQPDS